MASTTAGKKSTSRRRSSKQKTSFRIGLYVDELLLIHEHGRRLRRVMRGLTVDEQRVLRMHGIDDCPFHAIAATFGHSTSWADDVWEAAAAEVRTRLITNTSLSPTSATESCIGDCRSMRRQSDQLPSLS